MCSIIEMGLCLAAVLRTPHTSVLKVVAGKEGGARTTQPVAAVTSSWSVVGAGVELIQHCLFMLRGEVKYTPALRKLLRVSGSEAWLCAYQSLRRC